MDAIFKPMVIVTGFGPFVGHQVNASWEAVKLINKEKIEKEHGVELVQLELSVTYQDVNKYVPALWETHTPQLMIHVGVSSIAKCLTLEMQAYKKGYQRPDYCDTCPAGHENPSEGANRLHTKLNVEQLCKDFNDSCSSEENTQAVPSKDAGRFLCEYIYYTSLSINNSCTLFVHVPSMEVYSSEQTARGLERLLALCLEQLRNTGTDADLNAKLENVALEKDNSL